MLGVAPELVCQLLGMTHQRNSLVMAPVAQEQIIAPMRPPARGMTASLDLVSFQPDVRRAAFLPATDHALGRHSPPPPLSAFPILDVVISGLRHACLSNGELGVWASCRAGECPFIPPTHTTAGQLPTRQERMPGVEPGFPLADRREIQKQPTRCVQSPHALGVIASTREC